MAPLLLLRGGALLVLCLVSASAQNVTFKCATAGATCSSLIDYVSPNATTLKSIQTLFGVKNLRSILGANNQPISTPPSTAVAAKQTVRIPFPCLCSGGAGVSNRLPVYTVQKDDGLFHIAAEVFSGLVTYQQIAAANKIPDPNQIQVGQKLWIPLPCSCDRVDGVVVVHYGHVVESGGSLEAVVQMYGTPLDTLLTLNGLANSSVVLQAGQVLDVPLRACSSNISTNSSDYPLLVPNGTYSLTANNCVKCKCDAANNFTLQCEPSGANSSTGESCPPIVCEGGDNLSLSNTTTSGCNKTTCKYTGFHNQTILTALITESTCPAQNNYGSKIGLQAWSWNIVFIGIHLGLLCFLLF